MMEMFTHKDMETETLQNIKRICAGIVDMVDNCDNVDLIRFRYEYLKDQFKRLDTIKTIRNGVM